MKVKVVEIDAHKLDPNAIHLVVFHSALMNMAQKKSVAKQLTELGVKAVYTQCVDPESALKVYEIPKEGK